MDILNLGAEGIGFVITFYVFAGVAVVSFFGGVFIVIAIVEVLKVLTGTTKDSDN